MKEKKFRSILKSLSVIPLAAMVFTLIVCIAACIYSLWTMQEQFAERSKASLKLSAQQMTNSMERIEQAFAEYVTTNENHLVLKRCDRNTQAEKVLRYEANIRNWLNDLAGMEREIQTAFLYYENMDKFQFRGVSNYELQNDVRDQLVRGGGTLSPNHWQLQEANGAWYLLYVFHRGELYGGVWLPVREISHSLGLDSGTYSGETWLMDAQGKNTCPDPELSIQLPGAASGSVISKNGSRFKVFTEALSGGDISVGFLSLELGLFSRIPLTSRILFAAAAASLVIVALVTSWMRRRIVNPVRDIDEAMKIISEGNLDYRLPSSDRPVYNEFDRLSMHFNAMMDQLDEVQFKLYESRWREQKNKLNYVSQQIRPHFILNALNIIYTYDESEFPLVKKMVIYLTAYFRYIVNLKRDFVEVGEELEHTRNYLNIQKERYPHRFDYLVECGIGAEKLLIPPLIIQTFLENSIKYGMKDEGRSFFFVNVALQDDCAEIFIADSGKGFDEDILEKIRKFIKDREYTDELGVGIQNTIERLDILYDGHAEISFENEETGGATVRIVVPARYQSETEHV